MCFKTSCWSAAMLLSIGKWRWSLNSALSSCHTRVFSWAYSRHHGRVRDVSGSVHLKSDLRDSGMVCFQICSALEGKVPKIRSFVLILYFLVWSLIAQLNLQLWTKYQWMNSISIGCPINVRCVVNIVLCTRSLWRWNNTVETSFILMQLSSC